MDNFRFWDYPVTIPKTDDPDTNVYDMRFTQHEDGWIYGLFCTKRKDRSRPDDTSAATAACGIARTRDLVHWERLPDLISHAGQQRNVVLHPEFVDGKYALYTRPQDGFIEVGGGGGIGWGLTDSMERAEVKFNTDKHWWPQTEAFIGYWNAWELTGREIFAETALRIWLFIKISGCVTISWGYNVTSALAGAPHAPTKADVTSPHFCYALKFHPGQRKR